jgi:NAD(P)H-hydrate epimerase
MLESACGIWTPEAVRTLDRTATSALGIPGYELMKRAGAAVYTAAAKRWPDARRWVVFCGPGNNGGDGYVIARLARRAGWDVQVCALADPSQLTGDAATAWRDFAAEGGVLVPLDSRVLAEADLVVDAIVGTGLSRPVTGTMRSTIEAINAARRPVVAVDIPSGLDATSGHPSGVAVRADLTVTFVGRKLGLYLDEGPAHTGPVLFADLDIPPSVVERAGLGGKATLHLFTASELPRLLPRRTATAHKGNFGHVLVVGGNHGMSGAVRLAGEAALRAGAGLVSVATRPAYASLLPLVRPELMCHGIAEPGDLKPLLARATVVALGPGLGQDDWARGLLAAVLATPLPLVLDADALNLLATEPMRRADWVLTPHPGEAGRLLGCSALDVQRDRLGALEALQDRYGGTIVLKGSGTLVGRTGQCPWLIPTGNPGMATAGMGDVLTGVIAGVIAQARGPLQGVTPGADMAAAAAFIHGAAGDAAANAGQRGLVASDVLSQLRPWLNL